jgi:hypothetical protein
LIWKILVQLNIPKTMEEAKLVDESFLTKTELLEYSRYDG